MQVETSKLFWFFISNTSTAIQGDAYRLLPIYLEPFCFPKLTSHNKQLYEKLNKYVKLMFELHKTLFNQNNSFSEFQNKKIFKEINMLDAYIDDTVYKLYDITDEEKAIIESSV